MIEYKTSIENNQFYVRFNLYPKNVQYSRANYTATHKGGAGSYRKGIWEGVELYKVYGRVNSSNPWVDLGNKDNPVLHTHENGDSIQLRAIYRIWTMGYHWQCTDGSLPFFYYGNIGNNPNRYVHGYFTDGTPGTPTNSLHSIHAMVPPDWKHIRSEWSDWAYKHAQEDPHNWAKDSGRYEQRNATYVNATSSNGWISDSGYKQAWRKSCRFIFEKEFSVNITSSGIVKDASAPEITVQPAKGDGGRVTLKYIDKYNSNGKLWLRAYCKDQKVEIMDYDACPTMSNGGTRVFDVDFVKIFGESFRGNDIQYEAWARNSHGKEASTGKKGGHRFNGRPTAPSGLYVKGKNKDIIYDDITFSWKEATDPEKDSLTYELHLTTTSAGGSTVRDSVIATKVNGCTYNYNIANDSDNCSYTLKVRAHDGLLYGNWSTPLRFKKGAKPSGSIGLLLPEQDGTNLYCTRPRFVFYGYDGESKFVVIFNGKEYNTKDHGQYFTIQDDMVMFCMEHTNPTIKISAYMQNAYGKSEKSSEYNFKLVDVSANIVEDSYAQAGVINTLIDDIKDKSKAYNLKVELDDLISRESFIKAKDYNVLFNSLKTINNKINNIINTNKFDVTMVSQEIKPGTLNSESVWNKLIEDIRNI